MTLRLKRTLPQFRAFKAQKLSLASRNAVRLFSDVPAASEENLDVHKTVKLHQLEELVPSKIAAVDLRRERINRLDPSKAGNVKDIPCDSSDFKADEFYEKIYGVNCENVIGFLPLPLGVVGPLNLNNEDFYVPMATTEGALLASVNRGAAVIKKSGGCFSSVLKDGMTRAPVVELPSAIEAANFAKYIEQEETFDGLKQAFESTTSYGKLLKVNTTVAGKFVYIRFTAVTGDAMGMNMIGKGVNKIFMSPDCEELLTNNGKFTPKMVALSSNMCTDKKPSALNWVNGRGKSVVCETVIPESILKSVLKVNVADMIELNTTKNLIGSSLAGSIGGNNAHSSNIVTALFLATGQDPAQNVESSNCLVTMSKTEVKESGENALSIAVTMPCIEVGTVGGGTTIKAQKAALAMLGVAGANRSEPGRNAQRLAEIVAASVLAGEISLNAALCSNQLISAHMKLNRNHGQSTHGSPRPSNHKAFSTIQTRSLSMLPQGQVYDEVLQYYEETGNNRSDDFDIYDYQFVDNKLPVP